MKKILLFVAVAAMTAMSASADAGTTSIKNRPMDYMLDKNFVVNGNFEDPGFVQNDECYGWMEGADAEEIPGWNLASSGIWNGTISIQNQEPDDYMIFEGNTQYVHMYNYKENGWARIRMYTYVTGLEAGKQYRLDFYVAHLYEESLDWANPNQGFTFYDKPLSADEPKGAELVTVEGVSDDSEYEYYIYDFTATNDTMVFELWCQNYNGEGNASGMHWVDWDEVRIYDNDMVDWDAEDGIESIVADNAAAQEIYTLQGVRVPNNAELNGVYIVKQGKKVMKAVY